MAETTMLESVVADLLSRVKKLEEKPEHNHNEIQEYLGTLDRVAFSITIAIDVLSKVLVDKNLVTKEELNKFLNDEREKVAKALNERTAEPKPNPGT